MRIHLEKIIDKISLLSLVTGYVVWIVFFGLVYWIAPFIDANSAIASSDGAVQGGFWLSQFVSVSTATGSGFGDYVPTGFLRGFAVLELFGGIIFAGMAINLLASLPSRKTRLAAKACKGHWVEEISIPGRGNFYSFTYMARDGDVIRKDGYNFDPQQGPMDKTRFYGELITSYFPKMISRYDNDNQSLDYDAGYLEFDLKASSGGEYKSYSGRCFDGKHGCRDSIFAKRISDPEICQRLESEGELDDKTHIEIINKLFPRANLDEAIA
ncbi:MAG: ion channel [Bacteroidota bacterium]